jgi:hypothetical protein
MSDIIQILQRQLKEEFNTLKSAFLVEQLDSGKMAVNHVITSPALGVGNKYS